MNTAIYPSLKQGPFNRWLPLIVVLGLTCFGVLVCLSASRGLQVADGAKGYSAATLYNEGNACARAGKSAVAIVDYERAKLLAPNDANVSANLQWVRVHAGLPESSANRLEGALSWAGPNAMAWLGSLGLILTGTGLILARSFSGRRFLFRLVAIGGAVLLMVSIASAVRTWRIGSEAVVITPDAPGRISPTTVGEISFKMHPGEMTTMVGRHGDFVLLDDQAGHSGWVRSGDVEPIIP